MAVIKLLLRVIDNSVPTNRATVFKELLATLKVALLGLKTVASGFNSLLEKKEDANALLSDRGRSGLTLKNFKAMKTKAGAHTSETKTDKMFMRTKTKKLYLGTTGKRFLIYQTLKT